MSIDVGSRGKANQILSKSADSFEQAIADSTQNQLDIASQYSFSPERVRLFRNGSRQFPHYNSVSQFEDANDVWILKPDASDTMRVETAESATYTVQYDVETTYAFSLNQELQDGDILRAGPYNGTDGWFIEQDGSKHDTDEVDIYRSKGGSEVLLDENVELTRSTTEFARYSTRYNWYNVGHQVWTQTSTRSGQQNNNVESKTSEDQDRGTDTPNVPIWWEIQASSSTTGLELNIGSGGIVTLGDVNNLTRQKKQYESITLSGSTDTWEPVLAMRTDSDKPNVNMNLEELDILQYEANADVEMVVVSVDPSKTDASGFSINSYHHDYNSAVQTTESVSEVPDATNGTQQDLGASQKPGGHTIASAVQLTGGAKTDTARTGQEQTVSKKIILSSDVVVFLGRSSIVDENINFSWEVTQNW